MADASRGRWVSAALLAGFIGGTVDVGSASLIFHAPPALVLRAIASGLIGKAAAHGGVEIVALGVALQWAMSILIAAIYALAALKLPSLARRWPLWGLAYGIGVYFVMTYVVVPLSRAAQHPQSLTLQAKNVAAMMLFGLIVAFFARKLAPEKS
jgi:uncharacterized membrane protein YagU involved in acid resistance